jgi:hypothetical protein
MATLDGASQRRRLATYGKAARRRVQGVTTENDFAIERPRPTTSLYGKSVPSSSYRIESTLSTSAKHEARGSDDSGRLGSAAGYVSPKRTSDSSTNMFEVPSSEDESASNYDRPSNTQSRPKNAAVQIIKKLSTEAFHSSKSSTHLAKGSKKRKRDSERRTDISSGLLDDGALQRHIAMEVADNTPSSDLLGTITPPASSDEQHSSPSDDTKPYVVSHGHSTTSDHIKARPVSRNPSSTISRKSDNTQALSTERYLSKLPREDVEMSSGSSPSQVGRTSGRQRPDDLQPIDTVESGHHRVLSKTPEKSNRKLSRNTTPDRVRPNSHHSPMSITSPSQARLWHDLFPQAHSEPSPSQLKINQLTIDSKAISSTSNRKESLPVPKGISASISSRLTPSDPPRKRLIDLLDATGASPADNVAEHVSSPDRAIDVDLKEKATPEPSIISNTREDVIAPPKKSTIEEAGGPKRTYARQRSYLTDNDLLDAAKFSLAPETELGAPRKDPKLGTRRPTRLVPNLGPIDSLSNGPDSSNTGSIRSIHELRQAGGNKRYLDEVDAVLEDLDTGTLSGKRMALMSLVTKLSNVEYCRKFIVHGLDEKLFAFMSTEVDTICSYLYSAILSFVLSSSNLTGSSIQKYQPSIIKMVEPLLELERSILAIGKERRNNMSKAAQSQLADVNSTIQNASYWDGKLPDVANPFSVALKCLDIVLRKTRETLDTDNTLSSTSIHNLVDTLRTISEENILPTQSDLVKIELIMSILESQTLLCNDDSTRESLNSLLLPGIAACLSIILELQEDSNKSLQWLALRLTVNATSSGQSKSNPSEQPELTQALTSNVLGKFDALFGCIEQQDREFARDSLIISLASLINITEWSENARLWLSSSDSGKVIPLLALLDIFSQKLDTTSEVSFSSLI